MPRFSEDLLAAPELVRVSEDLRRLVRPAIRLRLSLQEESTIPLGQSKVGGYPDLPETLAWPIADYQQKSYGWTLSGRVALPFVVQLTCSELAPFDPTGLLPKQGRLYFFYGAGHKADLIDDHGVPRTDHLNDTNPTGFRVLWEPDEGKLVLPTSPPDNLPRAYGLKNGAYKSCTLICEQENTLPDLDSSWLGEPLDYGVLKLTRDEWEFYAEFTHENCDHPRHLIFGHTDDSQPYALEGGYAIVRPHFWPQLPPKIDPREYADNILLLQLDTDDHEMHFGRSGCAFFGIRIADLKEHRFEHAWAYAQ